ncbi:MAG: hypothetical protein K6F71_09155 [Ruminococcus sp.]|uniref:hypothetical protein n=1 Tax=Ruminococcus sp. TaxID=41978 RepID=UPI0025FDB2B0|nr:hypothetical protein [Ruminococcus sp.]MCR5540965.1 hypothetical protein [Ruminococcus sp.]
MDDLAHRGFECYNELMERCHPKYLLHGHVHATYGTRFRRVLNHPSCTKIINGYERYVLDIDETDLATMTRREITTRLIAAFL